MEEKEREAVYIVAVRTKLDPSGKVHHDTMEALTKVLDLALPGETVARGATVTPYSDLTANHNGYLREFGFDFDTANQILTVAWENVGGDEGK